MTKTTPKQVRKLLVDGGLMTMTPSPTAPGVPALVPIVAGGPVKGSWWGHAKGKEIYAVATALDEDPDVVSVKLLDGKVTFVHRQLFPALLRCVRDGRWRTRTLGALGPEARALETRIRAEGEIHFDPVPPGVKPALAALESRLIVLTTSVHTEKGHHAPAVLDWGRWAEQADAEPAAGTRAEALAELETAAGTSLPALA